MSQDPELVQLIKEFSLVPGCSGHENEVIQIAKDKIQTDDIQTDSMGNLYIGLTKAQNANKPIVAIDAHSDEVGFLVQSINKNGTLNIINTGGWVVADVRAQLLKVKTDAGVWISAIVGSTPPHFATATKELQLEDLYLDIGAQSADDVRENFGISLGAPVVPHGIFEYRDSDQMLMGKAFDNRLGCAGVVQLVNTLQQSDLDVSVVGIISAQEEVGLRGARVSAAKVKPDLAIILEGSPSDDKIKSADLAQCIIGKGVQLRLRDNTMIAHPAFTSWITKELCTQNIAHQLAVRNSGGTNGGSYHLANEGIPTCVLATPVRYAHTPFCLSSLNDFKSMLAATEHIIRNLNDSIIKRLHSHSN